MLEKVCRPQVCPQVSQHWTLRLFRQTTTWKQANQRRHYRSKRTIVSVICLSEGESSSQEMSLQQPITDQEQINLKRLCSSQSQVTGQKQSWVWILFSFLVYIHAEKWVSKLLTNVSTNKKVFDDLGFIYSFHKQKTKVCTNVKTDLRINTVWVNISILHSKNITGLKWTHFGSK